MPRNRNNGHSKAQIAMLKQQNEAEKQIALIKEHLERQGMMKKLGGGLDLPAATDDKRDPQTSEQNQDTKARANPMGPSKPVITVKSKCPETHAGKAAPQSEHCNHNCMTTQKPGYRPASVPLETTKHHECDNSDDKTEPAALNKDYDRSELDDSDAEW